MLDNFQGKDVNITEADLKKIKKFLSSKELSINDLSKDDIKKMLRSLTLQKHYEHIPYIKTRLTGKSSYFQQELEKKLIEIFKIINKIFDKNFPNNSMNFPTNDFILKKSLELLKIDKYNKLLSKLNPKKQNDYNLLWLTMQKDIEWKQIEFICTHNFLHY